MQAPAGWLPEAVSARLKLYLVLGSPFCRHSPEEVLQAAIRGGITLFQYREKGNGALTGNKLVELGRRLRFICRENGIPFIVNDDLELALELDAEGLHVGQEDAEKAGVAELRCRLGPSRILGVSAHNVEEAEAAVRDGADYLGVGPMYTTSSKADACEVQGPSLIRRLRGEGIFMPIVGIGGITASRSGDVIRAGADGVAVISSITGSADPEKEAGQILEMVHQARGHAGML
ncbi:thiamine phosphate synthase [Paenibacillus larvae]